MIDVSLSNNLTGTRKALPVQVSHTFGPDSAVFDDDNLVSCAGLVPVMALAEQAGLSELLDNKIHIAAPRIKSGSANPAPKLATLIASMCAGGDYIDDVDLVHAGGMKTLFQPGVRPVNGGNAVAGVHLRSCPPVGFRTGRTPRRPVQTGGPAARLPGAGVRRYEERQHGSSSSSYFATATDVGARSQRSCTNPDLGGASVQPQSRWQRLPNGNQQSAGHTMRRMSRRWCCTSCAVCTASHRNDRSCVSG
jgi:hypothetical protein